MKKILLLTISAATAFAIVACSKNKPPVNPVVKEEPAAVSAEDTAAAAPAEASIPNRQEFIAAVAAAIAEEMGTEVSKIRILSVKKI